MGGETKTFGLILAGGRSSRFGGAPKGLATLNGKALISHVIDSLEQSAGRIAIGASAETAADYAGLDHEILRDAPEFAGRGPLAGLLAGLDWAAQGGAQLLLIAPCDAPLLPATLWPRLLEALARDAADAAIAAGPSGLHPLCAALRPSLADRLRAYLPAPDARLAVRAFLDGVRTTETHFADNVPFLNVNTPADLDAAARILASGTREN